MPLYDRPMPAPRRRARHRAGRLALGPLLALTAAAIGGCTHVVRAGPGRTLQVALDEYRVDPSSASAASGVLTLIVRNYGRLSHNLVVSANGYEDGSTQAIPPGSEATLLLDLTPGVYTIYSSILNDDALGAHGTLTVRYR
jgi:hypothetical protein